MESIREKLRTFENFLQNDLDEFNSKLNSTRKSLFSYIDQQIEYLKNIKNEFNDELNYLDEENRKTCQDNQQEFHKLCFEINKNDHNRIIVSKLFEQFKQKFPMRPKMLKSIPEYNFKDIQIDDLIIKQNSPILDNNSSSPLINQDNHSFIPIDSTQISSLPTNSIGSSYHKQLASQNNENEIEPESRLVSTCSTVSEVDNTLPILFKILYQHNRSPRLMCFNEDDNNILIYSLFSHKFEYLSLNSSQIFSIDFSSDEFILNLGYSTTYHLFYLSTYRSTNRFVLFRLNDEEKKLEIEEEIELINSKDHFINVHMYENVIFYLYLSSSSIVMFGKYDLENSSFISSISFEKKLYDYDEKCPYKIIDFTVNNLFICFLIQFKNKTKSKIIIYDYENMSKLHSFDLIDSIKPISIISTQKKCKSRTTFNDDIQLLLYINDPEGRLIHCCTCEKYLISVNISNFGFCSLDNGNLVLIAKNDIRVLNVQDYIKKNKGKFD